MSIVCMNLYHLNNNNCFALLIFFLKTIEVYARSCSFLQYVRHYCSNHYQLMNTAAETCTFSETLSTEYVKVKLNNRRSHSHVKPTLNILFDIQSNIYPCCYTGAGINIIFMDKDSVGLHVHPGIAY